MAVIRKQLLKRVSTGTRPAVGTPKWRSTFYRTNGIYIIDAKDGRKIEAYMAVRHIAMNGGTVLCRYQNKLRIHLGRGRTLRMYLSITVGWAAL